MPGLPPNGAMYGGRIDGLMGVVHLLMLAVFLGWGLFFVLALVRGSRVRTGKGAAEKAGKLGLFSEVAIAVAELALLVGVALPIWSQRGNAGPADTDATVVRVVAEQYAWNIHYPGPDRVFGRADPALVSSENPLGIDTSDLAAKDDIVTLNVMHLPVGKPVVVYLTSKDVIHSFFLPLFRVKQDAIPGQRARVWFVPERTSAELRSGMASRYAVDSSDSTRDLSGLSPLEDVRDAYGTVVLSASTPLVPDMVRSLEHAGIRSLTAAPDTPTEIACAQLCGLGHYRMRGFVTVETDSAFSAWMAEQKEAQSWKP